jgi:hypothetical protein
MTPSCHEASISLAGHAPLHRDPRSVIGAAWQHDDDEAFGHRDEAIADRPGFVGAAFFLEKKRPTLRPTTRPTWYGGRIVSALNCLRIFAIRRSPSAPDTHRRRGVSADPHRAFPPEIYRLVGEAFHIIHCPMSVIKSPGASCAGSRERRRNVRCDHDQADLRSRFRHLGLSRPSPWRAQASKAEAVGIHEWQREPITPGCGSFCEGFGRNRLMD